MTILKLLKRGIGAVKEPVNLISLTILIVTSYLTGDSGLLGIGLTVELVYVVLALLLTSDLFRSRSRDAVSVLTSYQARLEAGVPSRNRGETEENFVLDQVLLNVTIAGVVIIIFFGFGKHLLTHRWYQLSHAQGWEAGAIWWTGFFLVYYLIKFKPTGNFNLDKVIFFVAGILSGLLWWKAKASIGEQSLWHIIFVIGIAACFLIIDLLGLRHEDPMERGRSRASLTWADIPMVFAFLVLLTFLWLHQDTEAREVFVAGVIACQLLISNAVFIVMEFGILQSPGQAVPAEKPDHVSTNLPEPHRVVPTS
jgi:hypothetical protein